MAKVRVNVDPDTCKWRVDEDGKVTLVKAVVLCGVWGETENGEAGKFYVRFDNVRTIYGVQDDIMMIHPLENRESRGRELDIRAASVYNTLRKGENNGHS